MMHRFKTDVNAGIPPSLTGMTSGMTHRDDAPARYTAGTVVPTRSRVVYTRHGQHCARGIQHLEHMTT